MIFQYYLYYFYYTFLGYPFVIRIAVAFISVFIPLFIIVSFIMAKTRREFYRKRKLKSNIEKEYIERIRKIITDSVKYTLSDIEKTLNCNIQKLNEKKRRLLTNKILYLKNEEKFINEANYQRLIDYLGLKQFWEKKLKYGSIASKQRALRKLDDFDIEIPGSIITYLTYNRNRYLRKRARSSYMYFSKNDPFKFLDENFDDTFNEWDKIEIHNVLDRRIEEGLPTLSQWIKNSNNIEFQCFLIDEIKHFNQNECASFLLELTDSHNIKLRKHSIDALGEMGYKDAENHLIKNYTLQPVSIRRSIIRTIQKLNTGKALSFLKGAYHNTHDNESKIVILNAVFNYGDPGKQLFDSMKEEADGFTKLIFEHVSNTLIRSRN